MTKLGYCLLFSLTFLFVVSCNVSNAQTIDELRISVKQLEEKNSQLEAKLRRLQKGKNQSEAEAEETIQLLQKENQELQAELDSIADEEKEKLKKENVAKSVRIEIKDPIFKEYLLRYCDMDNDGILSQWDAEHTYVIDIGRDKSLLNLIGSSNQIASIDGIEHFVNLRRLVCSGNTIPHIDLSKNKLLETFIANGCELKILDISQNDKLTHLQCSNNLLYTIDLKNNLDLKSLDVSKNKMATIDVSRCIQLEQFNCSGNALTNLDVSNNIELQTIDCSNNKLTALSFAKNTALDNINCSNNKLTDLDVRNGIDIKFIDCSKNKDLEFVYFGKGCRVFSDKRDPKAYFK